MPALGKSFGRRGFGMSWRSPLSLPYWARRAFTHSRTKLKAGWRAMAKRYGGRDDHDDDEFAVSAADG